MTESADTDARERVPSEREVLLRSGVKSALMALLLVIAIKGVMLAIEATTTIEIQTPLPATLLGVIIGTTYGLLSVGLVLIYRTSGIINFAHGQVGAFAAAVLGLMVTKGGWPYWIAFPIAMAAGGLAGAGAEVAVVRRLRNVPKVMSIVATLGVGQLLVLVGYLLTPQVTRGLDYPSPPGMPSWQFGPLRVSQAHGGMLVLAPLAVLTVAMFLRRSSVGVSMRAAAANPEAARMSGIFSGRMSSLAWGIAGALSTVSAVLTQPTQAFVDPNNFGPGLLLRAMAGAVLARMESLPRALMAGVGLGVVEQIISWNVSRSGIVEAALFAIILLALLFQRGLRSREQEQSQWAAVDVLRPLPTAVRSLPGVSMIPRLGLGLLLAAGCLLPLFMTNRNAVTMTAILGFTVIGLSVGILTGLAGQLTLGQFAVAAVGAVVSSWVARTSGNFGLAIVYAGVASAITSIILGAPALRLRSVMLTVTTLAFALMTPGFLLDAFIGDGQAPGRPVILGEPLDTALKYYWFALALTVVAVWVAANVRGSGFGRLMVAVRDNENAARAFAVPATAVKLRAFGLAGFLAGVGGALYGHGISSISPASFPVKASIDVVVMVVLGGVSMVTGPLLGALLVIGVPAFVPLDALGLAATSLGQLLLVLYLPSGLAGPVGQVRDRISWWIAGRHGITVESVEASSVNGQSDYAASPAAVGVVGGSNLSKTTPKGQQGTLALPLLVATGLRRAFGGVHAVRDVSLRVAREEIVGLIGPNGAGKTTTFELLGGFTKPDAGTVVFDGLDVTGTSPESRAKLGLIRSFQDAALFPSLTVQECIMVALERQRPTSMIWSLAGVKRVERARRVDAAELGHFLGLASYLDRRIDELSTGTRRIAELACLVALEPTMLLLDEPTSGIAQRESEGLGTLLLDLKREFRLTMLIIEHDIPLIMALSDRVVAMADGRVIARGLPGEVRNHPEVVRAYLGGSDVALERSTVAAATGGQS
ncbi:MAG: ABC-type branched-subunit amino acid transport system ATPase component [Glaciecola sp.]|jgi:ABC-type branched-subunit amino acid transport system ATPase component/ABC-type branched-subunit amino acid transport system permease subunit